MATGEIWEWANIRSRVAARRAMIISWLVAGYINNNFGIFGPSLAPHSLELNLWFFPLWSQKNFLSLLSRAYHFSWTWCSRFAELNNCSLVWRTARLPNVWRSHKSIYGPFRRHIRISFFVTGFYAWYKYVWKCIMNGNIINGYNFDILLQRKLSIHEYPFDFQSLSISYRSHISSETPCNSRLSRW